MANELGISIEKTVAVGDSLNDMTMIQKAGLGLATSNASDTVKSGSDRIICSNNENVAVYLLENLF